MVYEGLKSKMPNLSLGTVYRNLRLLEEMGKIRRVSTMQNMERYDARCEEHVHFVCDVCGKVKDMDMVDMRAVECARKAETGETVQWMRLIFGGKCKKCSLAVEA